MMRWTATKNYNQELIDLIYLLESRKDTVYLLNDGKATIGIGYTFNRSNNLSIWQKSGIELTAQEIEVLKTIDSLPNSEKTSYTFDNFKKILTEQDTKKLLTATLPEYEDRVDAFFKDVPPSHERAALVSLSYNGGLGPNLQKALQADNHAEAWYQIRYETNGGASRSSGLANRRYIEAHMFGLFGGETPTIEESRQAAQMYALHRDKILAYEALFAPETASKVKDFPGIFNVYQEFTPIVDALKAAYHLPDIKIEEVQMASSAHLDLNGDGTPYDTANNDQDLLIGNDGNNVLSGGAGDDVLVGSRGNDTLSGGSGRDTVSYWQDKKDVGYSASENAMTVVIDKTVMTVGNNAGTKFDVLTGIEALLLGDQDDRVIVDSLRPLRDDLRVDGGKQATLEGDFIDFSGLGSGVLFFRDGATGDGRVKDASSPDSVRYSGFEHVIGTSFGDVLNDRSSSVARFDLGGGDDVVQSAAGGVLVDLGPSGKDTVYFNPGVGISNFGVEDQLSLGGVLNLYGGTRSTYSETPYATSFGGMVRWGLNKVGDLALSLAGLGSSDADNMYVLGWNKSYGQTGNGHDLSSVSTEAFHKYFCKLSFFQPKNDNMLGFRKKLFLIAA